MTFKGIYRIVLSHNKILKIYIFNSVFSKLKTSIPVALLFKFVVYL